MQGDAGECPEPIPIVGRLGIGLAGRLRLHFQKLAALCELLLSMPVTKQTVIAYPLQSLRQCVQQKAADELVRREGHGLLGVVVAVVLPAEGDGPIVYIEETIVRDGNAM